MRAVLDPNVIISALLSPGGAPAKLLRAWLDGAFEMVVSAQLLAELRRALAYPKLRARIEPSEADELIDLLRRGAAMVTDRDDPPIVRSHDPGDDYLVVVAHTARAVIVSGDRDLLALAGSLPVLSPADFLAEVETAT